MRTIISPVCLALLCSGGFSNAQVKTYYCQEVSATNGLKLELCVSVPSGKTPMEGDVWYQFKSPTMPWGRVYIPDKSHLCTIELADADGKSVVKTTVGEWYGAKFEDSKYKWSNRSFEREKDGQAKRSGVVLGGSGHFYLPRLAELFQTKKASSFRLRVRLQVWNEVLKDGKFATMQLVRFPELELDLPSATANSPGNASGTNNSSAGNGSQ